MPEISSGSILGSTIETAELAAGAVSYAKLGSDVDKWQLLETLTFSADTTKTTGTLTACDDYMIRFRFIQSASGSMGMRINGDTGSNYGKVGIINTTTTISTGFTQIWLCKGYTDSICAGVGFLPGKTPAVANGVICMLLMHGSSSNTDNDQTLHGEWKGGNNVQVETLTFYASSGTITGVVEVYGK